MLHNSTLIFIAQKSAFTKFIFAIPSMNEEAQIPFTIHTSDNHVSVSYSIYNIAIHYFSITWLFDSYLNLAGYAGKILNLIVKISKEYSVKEKIINLKTPNNILDKGF